MDTTLIVEKALKGEDYSADVQDFTPEQQTQVSLEISKAAKKLADENIAKATATSQEAARRAAKAAEGAGKETETVSQFRSEQLQKAKNKLFSNPDYALEESDKARFDELFKKLDTGKVDSDLIYEDLVTTYVALKPGQFIKAAGELGEMRRNATSFNAASANASVQMSGPEGDKFSPAAKDLFSKWAQAGFDTSKYTLEAAQKVVNSGMTRNL